MPISSRWARPIPACSLQTWILGSCFDPLPSTDAFVDPDRPITHRLSFPAFRLLAKRVGLGLIRHGLRAGDRVLVYAGNSILYPALFLGILMAGGVFTGASPAFTVRELAYQLADSGARLVLAAADKLDTALEAADQAGLPPGSVVVADDTDPNSSGWIPGLLAPGRDAEAWRWVEPTDPAAALCCLNYSSGTTGFPKGVEVTHRAYVANCVGSIPVPGSPSELGPPVSLCFLPMYHVFSQTYFIAVGTQGRGTTYVMARFDLARLLSHVEAFEITQLVVVPPVLGALVRSPITRTFDLGSLRSIRCGAAPLAPELARAAAEGLRGRGREPAPLSVRQGWGMTELTCTGLTWAWDNLVPDPGSVGELAPNCRAKLVDLADGATEITAARIPGELWIAGPAVMRGYWGRPDETSRAIVADSDGTRWLRTGDVAWAGGPRGYGPGAVFYIVDRVKELIKVRGRQVAPAELEALLLERDDVADAAVVRVTMGGEEAPRAYVVMMAAYGQTAGEAGEGDKVKELARWVAERVAGYKRLIGGIVLVDVIPRTASGKILRQVLRERAQREVGDKVRPSSRLA